MGYFKNIPSITDVSGTEYTAFRDYTDIKKFSYKLYTIKDNEEFRPDKVSFSIYQNPDYDWVLNLLNDFKHGFSDYYSGREIKYLSSADLKTLL